MLVNFRGYTQVAREQCARHSWEPGATPGGFSGPGQLWLWDAGEQSCEDPREADCLGPSISQAGSPCGWGPKSSVLCPRSPRMWLFLWFTGSQSRPDVGCREQPSGAQVPSGHAGKSLSPLGSGSPLSHRHHLVFSFLAAHPGPAYLLPPSPSLQIRPLHGLVPRDTSRYKQRWLRGGHVKKSRGTPAAGNVGRRCCQDGSEHLL